MFKPGFPLKGALACAGALLLASQPVMADESGWDHSLAVYLWGADIDGTTVVGDSISVSFNDLLDNLEFGAMAAYQGRKGKWSVLGDAIYLDVEGDGSVRFGGDNISIGVDGTLGIEGLVLNLGGGYNLYDDNEGTITDVVFGARYLDLSADLTLRPDFTIPEIEPEFTADISDDVWDVIAGFRGSIRLGARWFLPWGATVGTGDSDLTWQAVAGIAYQAADWVDIGLHYRYLKWEFDDEDILADISFSGPMIGAKFHF